MNLLEVINKRRSARSFLPDPIPEDALREMIEAARFAPSGGNGQSWYFGIVKDEQRKIELAKAAGEQDWIASAPVIIAYCAKIDVDIRDLPEEDFGLVVNKTRFGDDFIAFMNSCPDRKTVKTFWSNSVPLIPGEHIFLTAVSHGLSACWIGYLDINKAGEILDLPEDIVCLFVMPIGYTNEQPQEIYRKHYEEIIFNEKWNGGIINDK
jgi:nitroreductase